MSLSVYLKYDTCPACGRGDEVFSQNITHNLWAMANEAGIYQAIWRPEENNITHAEGLIEPLREAITDMKAHPARYKKYNPSNGWGTYDDFVPWLERYLEECEKYPDATIEVCR